MFDPGGQRTRRIAGVMLALCLIAERPVAAAGHPPVALTMYVKLDRVESDAGGTHHGKVGDVDRILLTYDGAAVDPATRRVPLSSFEHLTPGRHPPPRPDSGAIPVDDSWLDLSRAPYRLHFKAFVMHGEPIVIEVDESTRRLTIHRPNDAAAVVIAGPYWIDSTPERAAPRRSR